MSGRPVSSILTDIVRNLQEIVRSEARLARAEVREETAKAVRASAFLMAAGFFAMYAFFFLLLGAALYLTRYISDWAAMLAVAGGLAVIGGILSAVGAAKLKEFHAPPSRTIKNVKETARWAKEQIV